jgi:glutathione synthase
MARSRSGKPKPSKLKRRILWITDPWDTLDHSKDTSLRLIQAAHTIGDENYWCDPSSIQFENGHVTLSTRRLVSLEPSRKSEAFQWDVPETRTPGFFDQIHYRPDPPVDAHYISPLWLLRLDPELPELVNPITTLLQESEKLAPLRISELSPDTLVTAQSTSMIARAQSATPASALTILKPLHQAQSRGVEQLTPQTRHAWESKIHQATQNSTSPALLQAFLPEIAQGETRLWFIDGDFLAALKKHPLKGDFRVHIDRGSEIRAHSPTPAELKAIPKISRLLGNLGIRLAAVDLVSGKIIDFNFTSPGLLVQLEFVHGQDFATPIMKALRTRPSAKRPARSAKSNQKTSVSRVSKLRGSQPARRKRKQR